MGSLQYSLQCWHLAWVESVNPECFVRPEYLSSSDIPMVCADVTDLLRFGQERLATPQCVLGALAGGNVDDHPGKEAGRAVRCGDARGMDVDPDRRTVLAHVALLGPVAARCLGHDQIEELLGIRAIVPVSEIAHRHLVQLIPGIANHLLERRVCLHETQVASDGRDADGCRLEHGPPT